MEKWICLLQLINIQHNSGRTAQRALRVLLPSLLSPTIAMETGLFFTSCKGKGASCVTAARWKQPNKHLYTRLTKHKNTNIKVAIFSTVSAGKSSTEIQQFSEKATATGAFLTSLTASAFDRAQKPESLFVFMTFVRVNIALLCSWKVSSKVDRFAFEICNWRGHKHHMRNIYSPRKERLHIPYLSHPFPVKRDHLGLMLSCKL